MNWKSHSCLIALLEIFLATPIAFAETNAVNFVSLVSTNISIIPCPCLDIVGYWEAYEAWV
jgi:hypothetical protein